MGTMTRTHAGPRGPRAALLLVALLIGLVPGQSRAEDFAAALRETLRTGPASPGGAESERELLALQAFYEERAFRPLWVDDSGPLPRARALAEIMAAAGIHGLREADYGVSEISARLADGSARRRAELEYLLSRALIRYGGDLSAGSLEPAKVDKELFLEPKRAAPATLLAEAAAAPNIGAYLDGLAPTSPNYQRLKQALADYREVARRGGWTKVPDGETLKPGMRDPRVATLRQRLAETGDLEAAGGEPELFDAAVEQAVLRFQGRHGLDRDGAVGKQTIEALNVPIERRIDQMVLNMERRRWMPDDLGRKYVFANMADFELKIVDGPGTVFDTRIVVGLPYLRTPVFSGTMTYVVINPYWHITPSIARSEMLPKIREDVSYLAKNNIKVLSGWGPDAKVLDPTQIDWNSVSRSNFTYKLRQDSGPENALGRIKFMFPNSHNVYMHDTPSRALFERTVRSFSHGCIRVQNPLEFATFLFRGDPEWTREALDAAVASGQRQTIKLKEPIPVHLTYLTAWVNKDGSVHFRDDIYGRDKRLEAALRRAWTATD